jgi:uncharacterized SAM-binding protein YcdF (DUF218 family)
LIYLHKILPIFVLPFGITLILLLAGLVSRRRPLVWIGFVVLWFSSTPLVSARLMRATEGPTERINATDAPAADAIVVLSEGRTVAPGRAAISEWGDADRFFGGVELFLAGKAPLLVFTGGWTPWTDSAPLEGDILARYATAMGVGPDHILTTGLVTTTAEEAVAVAARLRERGTGAKRVLLVTSAYHMPRAQRLFERAGLTVLAFPVDFQVGAGRGVSALDFLPSAGALGQTQTALRELYGRLFYRALALW